MTVNQTSRDLEVALTVSPAGLFGALKIMVVALSAVAAFVLLTYGVTNWFKLDYEAVYWSGAGVVLLSFTILRPWWFWYHPTMLLVRKLLTDWGAMALYLGIAGWMMLTGVRRQIAINHARSECTRQLALAKNTQERISVLYGTGATGLPSVDAEPRSLTCERVLNRP